MSEATYTTAQFVRLTGIPKRQLCQLAQDGVLTPIRDESRYPRVGGAYVWSERDMKAVRAVAPVLKQRAQAARLTPSTAPQPMTIERAVEVLNRERHDGECCLPWVLADDGEYVNVYDSHPGWGGRVLRAFEAIAIAEKYEREK